MNEQYTLDYLSPIGVIEVVGNKEVVTSIMFSDRETVLEHGSNAPDVLKDCCHQLHQYFKGERHTFTFPFEYKGTPFQQEVWAALVTVPYAHTASYRDIANSLQKEKADRAVGNANGRNRLSIVIPCHRIIGSNGTLTGYAGGLWRKEWLLNHEKTVNKVNN
ncbi:methylated-DNA--[protein]-cysteine S-methyltransferase [Fictibacillus nanhaiensis]|uniref:methylated-DNA--[protein]-cysteine S-methyltransferase n=1 Tax=Fictibacillus nanhaiensis TaxID=742169 RepID=UPI001C93E0F0|nr:methylated-DNA--[protein]-cysteine S-methyltransferase [Fictibacillus nanhaiensis]MBY6037675.1 methylated-DNA--[protein]-cysteine S-methyltransferase [Fictibacillus nanhaiensis]